MIKSVPYLEKCDDELLQKLVFSLKPKVYDDMEIVLAPGQKAQNIIFVERGTIEVYSQVPNMNHGENQGQEFVIDLLGEGCSINSRAYISQDYMAVSYRAKKDCRTLCLERAAMDEIIHNYAFGNSIGVYEARILKAEQSFYLDYTKFKQNSLENRLRNKFKNVLITIIHDIREKRKRPTLIKFLQIYQKQAHLPNAKEEFQKKFKMMYGEEVETVDKKFDELTRTYDRVQKTISQQHRALDHLVKKANKLIEQKQKNEARRR